MMTILLAAALAGEAIAVPDGARLREGTQCFTITRAGSPVGRTWQAIRAVRAGGRLAWDVVVHQRQDDGGFDMRDHFVVDRATLRPLSLESARGVERGARGWHRVSLRYEAGRIVGTRQTTQGVVPIDVALDHAVWDGNLWGLTFAALPLRQGGRYTLPVWQYDKGFGTFTVNVVGRERVEVPGGRVDAWVLEAGDDPAGLIRYVVAAGRPMEIGYSAGPFGQRLGGDCSALAGAETRPVGRR